MIQKIDLKDRIAILTEENICDLLNLYGELNIDRFGVRIKCAVCGHCEDRCCYHAGKETVGVR